jgi:hypothetical protein
MSPFLPGGSVEFNRSRNAPAARAPSNASMRATTSMNAGERSVRLIAGNHTKRRRAASSATRRSAIAYRSNGRTPPSAYSRI